LGRCDDADRSGSSGAAPGEPSQGSRRGAEDLLWKYLQIKKRFRDSMKDKDVNLPGLISLRGQRQRVAQEHTIRRTPHSLAEEHATVIGEVYIKGEQQLSKWAYAKRARIHDHGRSHAAKP
jgi:hypothetical protein